MATEDILYHIKLRITASAMLTRPKDDEEQRQLASIAAASLPHLSDSCDAQLHLISLTDIFNTAR